MDEFAEHMYSGILLMAGGVSQWDESTPTRIEDLKKQLDVFVQACDCELELINAALDTASGHPADLNRSTKIKGPIEDLDVSDVKPGWGKT